MVLGEGERARGWHSPNRVSLGYKCCTGRASGGGLRMSVHFGQLRCTGLCRPAASIIGQHTYYVPY